MSTYEPALEHVATDGTVVDVLLAIGGGIPVWLVLSNEVGEFGAFLDAADARAVGLALLNAAGAMEAD